VLLDPQQFRHQGFPRDVDDIVAKLYQRAWAQQHDPQPLGWMLMVSDPDSARELLARPDAFPKYYSFLTELGQSRFNTNGTDWEQRRALTQPLYSEAATVKNRESIRASYGRWLTDEAVLGGGVDRALLAGAAEVFLRALGGQSESGPYADWLLGLRRTGRRVQHIAMFTPDAERLAQVRADVGVMRENLRDLLREDRALVKSFASRMQDVGTEIDGLAEITLNLFAGTETTLATLGWLLHVLARHQDLQDQIARDLSDHGVDAPSMSLLIQEVMRYFPPVPVLTRKVARDGETLAGRPVPKGKTIALSTVGLHLHQSYWQDPDQFLPDRAEFREKTYNRRVYLPFSAGPRVCGGLGLARSEVAIALAEILSRFQVAPLEGPIAFEFALNLRPKSMKELTFHRRSGSPAR
jgi:cytochrome P450